MTGAQNDQPSGTAVPRYVVVAGGEPTPQELAAVAVALTPIAVPAGPPAESRSSGWALAALHEGVGDRRLVSADHLATIPGT